MNKPEAGQHGLMSSAYARLGLAMLISLMVMFVLSMAFVDSTDHYYLNLGNFYMALTMVAPMGLIMLGVMRSMFPNRMINGGLVVGFAILFLASLWLGRTQAFVGNEQFLRGMIPHHSRAILVCENADITDPDIAGLCEQIIQTQQEEIDIMQRMLDER